MVSVLDEQVVFPKTIAFVQSYLEKKKKIKLEGPKTDPNFSKLVLLFYPNSVKWNLKDNNESEFLNSNHIKLPTKMRN